ncbi:MULTISPECIES: hypothetical protein [unclassified Moraxella]|uniref:hypothetical protein n=1 Tax=unclassified Moraxella TaxID=2685852 RepID=UPI003AF9005A
MAWEKFHSFLKTSIIAEKYDTEEIVENHNFNSENDYLFINSRRNGLKWNLKEIFQTLNDSFGLEFLLNDEDLPHENLDETQIIFSSQQQMDVINSIHTLYQEIENQRPKLLGDDIYCLVQKAKLLETSNFSFEDNDSMTEAILTIEEIRRFFEDSVKKNQIIIKYESNS